MVSYEGGKIPIKDKLSCDIPIDSITNIVAKYYEYNSSSVSFGNEKAEINFCFEKNKIVKRSFFDFILNKNKTEEIVVDYDFLENEINNFLLLRHPDIDFELKGETFIFNKMNEKRILKKKIEDF